MGVLKISSLFVLTCWVLSIRLEAHCDCPGISLKLLQAPHEMSDSNSATFAFESYFVTNGEPCTTCNFTCKLDDGKFSECEDRKVTYGGLWDGKHSFKVCSNGSAGLDCACHKWKIDTVPPTASLTSSTSFTNALNFTVNVSFSETCSGGGGFRCSTVEGCNLHVCGAGQVVPSSLRILQPNLTYSLLVSLDSSSQNQNGGLILFMDKDFCNDSAGNRFMQTKSSNLTVNYDRRSVSVNLTTLIGEQIFLVDGQNRTVQATNDRDHLKIYLNFSQPILNSSADILSLLNISTGSLVPITGYTEDNRSFGFAVVNESSAAVVTITINSNFILTRQGTIVSPTASVTFLYDTERPEVRLHTFPLRTRERIIPVSIEFTKPVSDFNMSNIVISGGHFHRLLSSFQEDGWSIYNIEIEAEHDNVSVHFPENVTADVAGNKNTASDSLQVRHYTIPTLSRVVSTAATAAFLATSFAAGLLSITTASLQSLGAFRDPPSFSTSEPSRNLFRMVCHMQVFALSRWLPVVLPVEYYELARGIQWTIPYFSLPWGAGHIQSNMAGASPSPGSKTFITSTANSATYASIWPSQDKLGKARAVNIPRPNPEEYSSLKGTNNKSKDPYIYDPQNANGWRDFGGNMFWLAVIGGGLMLLHALLLLILKSKKKNSGNQRDYGALSFPRFEIFLLILVLPCICQASADVIRGRTTSGIVVGILLVGLVSFALLTFLIFLSSGITYGKLVQYEEGQQVDRRNHWYQELIRVTLGPGERGRWTWKKETNSNHLIMFGPLFEDLRGPAEYMNSQISGSNPREGDRKDETEDAEPLFIQKLFSILRIYYPLLECIKRVSLGIIAGAYSRNQSSRTPTITLLCITGFQLFSLVLKKPFISKRVQLVEIISVSTEVCLFASCAARREYLAKEETSIGVSMVMLFLVGFVAQMVNEWCALYLQTKRLGQNDKSFSSGLKVASRGLVSFFLSSSMIQDIESMSQMDQPESREPADTSSSADRNRSSSIRSSSTDKQRPRHQRDLARASFSEEGNKAPTDSSRTIWSGFWGCIRNESFPSSVIQDAESMIPTDQLESREPADTNSSADRNRSSSSKSSGIDKSRLRHQRDLAKASVSKEESKAPTNPLSNIWSGFWGCIRNESLPSSAIQDAESMIPIDQPESREPADTSSSADRNRSSSSQRLGIDKPRLRHQRDLAKASFSKEGNKTPTDSSSTIWSGFWGCIRNESLPSSVIQDAESIIPTDQPESREFADINSLADRNRSSSSQRLGIDKLRLRHQRDLAKASFSKGGNNAPTDSSSTIWSGFWGCIRNESLPSSVTQDAESTIPTDQPESREPADTSSSADRNRSSSSWSSSTVKQKPRNQRDLAKASFSQERNKAPTDRSSSIWSGFWGCIRSESLPSSMIQDTKSMIPTDQPESTELVDTSSSADRNRSFSS